MEETNEFLLDDNFIGQTIADDFKIISKIKTTHQGDIYLADQLSVKRKVTIKIYPIDKNEVSQSEDAQRFLREARIMAKLEHPNILNAIQVGQTDEFYYFVTEFEEVKLLKDIIAEKGALDEIVVLSMFLPLADALNHFWNENKILHRDVKPNNMVITRDGKVKLINFQIAKPIGNVSADLTMSNFVLGTPEYMSPERLSGKKEINFSSDIYSFGVSMYHCLTGNPPFVNENIVDLIESIENGDIKPATKKNPAVSKEVSDFVAKLFKKSPEDRPSSWTELINEGNKVLKKLKEKNSEDRQMSAEESVLELFGPIQSLTRQEKSSDAENKEPQSIAEEDEDDESIVNMPLLISTIIIIVLFVAIYFLFF
ncbi:MAG: serine/threonine-protein kinase [Verrucomicrobiota bacterium]|nr:serine/threonine-protein kinase [Verrucomicrobiota bacterium]